MNNKSDILYTACIRVYFYTTPLFDMIIVHISPTAYLQRLLAERRQAPQPEGREKVLDIVVVVIVVVVVSGRDGGRGGVQLQQLLLGLQGGQHLCVVGVVQQGVVLQGFQQLRGRVTT